MHAFRDIKITLFFAYAVGYPLAVIPPLLLDPILKSHVTFSARQYPYGFLCLSIYLVLLSIEAPLLRTMTSVTSLYVSVVIFFVSILLTLPIFLPEFPHGNVFSVGATTTFLSAVSIFTWSWINDDVLVVGPPKSVGVARLGYVKELSAFFRQAIFAAVALFGVLFFSAFGNMLKYAADIVTDRSEPFLLNLNVGFQVGFYAVLSIVGAVRYLFLMNIKVLMLLKKLSAEFDHTSKASGDIYRKSRYTFEKGRSKNAGHT
jgi:hypothetical protein